MQVQHAAWPRPGVLWGEYPERRARSTADTSGRALRRHGAASDCAALASAARAAALRWMALSDPHRAAELAHLRIRLKCDACNGDVIADALGAVVHAARQKLGVELFDTQLFAAAALLRGRLAEMATGEGKTLAIAAAAAVAALAGVPVHVITANDYLVDRDASTLGPLYRFLDLTVAAIRTDSPPQARRTAYASAVAYCTARELVFDYLRDRELSGGPRRELERRAAALSKLPQPQPLLRGLCMAVIDEADSVLLDDATVPLVLSEQTSDAEHRARLWGALTIARKLHAGAHFCVDSVARLAELTEAGQDCVDDLARACGPLWRNTRHCEDLVSTALVALHAYHADRDYLVREGNIRIIDTVSGRVADGRVWSRGLHGLIELKEGLRVSPDTRTVAQTTYQQFFPRYLRLSGISGTVREARRELERTYGLQVMRVPLRVAARRQRFPTRLFRDSYRRWEALAARVADLQATRRPVLVGTDSVADSETVSGFLSRHGISHAVLNARQDHAEAAIVARAGQAGAVTVATNMAGRGTDIVLGPGVEAAGGLHVICCQHNSSRRLDRQLEGRCARQGDAGSFERWLSLDSALFRGSALEPVARLLTAQPWPIVCTGTLATLIGSLVQVQQERRDAAQRRRLRCRDREWDRGGTFAMSAE